MSSLGRIGSPVEYRVENLLYPLQELGCLRQFDFYTKEKIKRSSFQVCTFTFFVWNLLFFYSLEIENPALSSVSVKMFFTATV